MCFVGSSKENCDRNPYNREVLKEKKIMLRLGRS